MRNRFRFAFYTLVWAILLAAYVATTPAQTSTTNNQGVTRKESAPQAAEHLYKQNKNKN